MKNHLSTQRLCCQKSHSSPRPQSWLRSVRKSGEALGSPRQTKPWPLGQEEVWENGLIRRACSHSETLRRPDNSSLDHILLFRGVRKSDPATPRAVTRKTLPSDMPQVLNPTRVGEGGVSSSLNPIRNQKFGETFSLQGAWFPIHTFLE